jgi:hypothetical protein
MNTHHRPRLWFVLAALATLLLAVGALACSSAIDGPRASSGDNDGGVSRGGDSFEAPEGAPPAGDDASGGVPIDGESSDPALQGLIDRKIIQSASVDLEVDDVARTFQELIRLTGTSQGFVVGSTFSNDDGEQIADLTIRVPADQYHAVLAGVRDMGEVTQEQSDANDVTEEYTDLGARLRALQATEQRYLELLARAETIPDIITVQDRLDVTRAQIEQVQGRINLLDNLTELATITVHLRPAGAAGGGGGPQPLEVAERAWEASLEAVRGVAAGALAVAVFSWWLVPPAVALGFGLRWWLARRPQRADVPL